MRCLTAVLCFVLFSNLSSGQVPDDALRYSFLTGQGGTARIQALGGAGGSLGGEFSNLFMNPAGLGFFKSGDFVLTPSLMVNSNSAHYLGCPASANNTRMGLGASGVLLTSLYNNRKLKSMTIGIGVNRSADFGNTVRYSGVNTSSSFSEQYLEEFRDNRVTDQQAAGTGFPFGSSMAFNTFLINPTFDANNQVDGYYTLANPAFGLQQQMSKTTSGGITEIALGAGANYADKIFIGGTITLPILRYHSRSNYVETDMSGDNHNDFNFFEADEDLLTKGIGVNAKLGMIYKPASDFQLGFSFYTPTFFQLTDLYNMTITTDPEGFEGQGVLTQSSSYLNDGNALRTIYNLSTPLRLILSGTYFISTGTEEREQRGFVTADAEYVNYRSNNFLDASNDQNTRDYFKQLNQTMDQLYTPAINARVGGEVRLSPLMIRLGGAYYGNPYKSSGSDFYKLSGGVGYRYNGFYIDLAYIYTMHKYDDYPYMLEDVAVSPARINDNGSNVALTLGFKLN